MRGRQSINIQMRDSMPPDVIKVLRPDELASFRNTGHFAGSADDVRDGFIHLSTPHQIPETLIRHYSDAQGRGESGLSLLRFAADRLGAALKWEPSRGGDLFPHFYGELELETVADVFHLAVATDGRHILPEDCS